MGVDKLLCSGNCKLRSVTSVWKNAPNNTETEVRYHYVFFFFFFFFSMKILMQKTMHKGWTDSTIG